MSIRFAAPPEAMSVRLTPMAARAAQGRAANDNRFDVAGEPMLRASLRHFAEHGLAAAQQARARAEAALRTGDQRAYNWWLGICATLDRRMARDLAAGVQDAG